MSSARYYLSIFLRRLPYFIIVTAVISAAAVILAVKLPPSYVSTLQLIVESPQISNDTTNAPTTAPAEDQLQILQQRLLTRANLLDIAHRFRVIEGMEDMNPDQIVAAMLSRTSIEITGLGSRSGPPLMTVTFEAHEAQIAADVLNEYLSLILKADAQERTDRAVNTLEFFQQEVSRLSAELAERSARILAFKTANADALPDSLDYRLGQQSLLQERLGLIERDIFGLTNQRDRLLEIFQDTGRVADAKLEALTPEQRQLETLKGQLREALAIYSPENPRVKLLEAQIAQLESVVNAQPRPTDDSAKENTGNTTLDLQLAAIDSRLSDLTAQKKDLEAQLKGLAETIERTPGNAIRLDELTLDYENIQLQYNSAVDRLAKASANERIEFMARGQRVSVIEPPAVASQPSKPNRKLIIGGGGAFAVLAGLAVVVLLEFLNRSIRRPADMVSAFGIAPLATLPYVQTDRERLTRRIWKFLAIVAAIAAVPIALTVIHLYFQPLDLTIQRFLGKLGM